MAVQSHERTKVFISYSHRDEAWLERLRVHLRPLERAKRVEYWCDKNIDAGARWREEIAQALVSTKVAVLLMSADFIASDFIASEELPSLLDAAEKEGAVILPLIVNHSRFNDIPSLSQFQAVNDPSKPLAGLDESERERVLVKLTEAIDRCLNDSLGAGDSAAVSSRFFEASSLGGVGNESPVTMPDPFRYFLDWCIPLTPQAANARLRPLQNAAGIHCTQRPPEASPRKGRARYTRQDLHRAAGP